MGQIRIGRLPRTLRWQGVVGLLRHSPDDVAGVARATAGAAEARLRELSRDPSLTYCFWLLTRIASASRSPSFLPETAKLGLKLEGADSGLTFISQVSDRVRSELKNHPESGPFSELSSLALRSALSETVGQESRSLFGSSLEDVERAVRRHSTPARFGDLARRFFGDFLARTLRFFVDKELSNHVGPSHVLTGVERSQEFAAALEGYARQSARIVETFAEGWYGKHHWESRGEISHEEAQGFVAIALRKLRMELARSE